MTDWTTMDPRDVPTYGIADASRYVRVPQQTVRNWVGGTSRRPLITPLASPGGSLLLSFHNLAELHVLAGFRKVYGLGPRTVRRTVEYLDRHADEPHPLTSRTFLTDGEDIFLDEARGLVNTSQGGQVAFRELVSVYLQRVERDAQGLAARLFPFTRTDADASAPRVVVIDPRISFGRPVLAGTRVPTDVLAGRWLAGDSIEDLADDFRLTTEQVQEAIRCESVARAA